MSEIKHMFISFYTHVTNVYMFDAKGNAISPSKGTVQHVAISKISAALGLLNTPLQAWPSSCYKRQFFKTLEPYGGFVLIKEVNNPYYAKEL